MFKIGDRVRLIDSVKHYAIDNTTKPDVHGWFTVSKPHPSEEAWWYLAEAPDGIPFRENEMLKAKKPTIIIYD